MSACIAVVGDFDPQNRHPFFLATLFLPQARSTPSRPHPLLAGYAAAAVARRGARVAS